jgi:hypothetical protein
MLTSTCWKNIRACSTYWVVEGQSSFFSCFLTHWWFDYYVVRETWKHMLCPKILDIFCHRLVQKKVKVAKYILAQLHWVWTEKYSKVQEGKFWFPYKAGMHRKSYRKFPYWVYYGVVGGSRNGRGQLNWLGELWWDEDWCCQAESGYWGGRQDNKVHYRKHRGGICGC